MMTMAAYWKTMFSPQKSGKQEFKVEIANEQMGSLHTGKLLPSPGKIVNYGLEEEILGDLIAAHGGGFDSSLQESLVAEKHSRLNKSVKLLEESKEVVVKVLESLDRHVSPEKA